MTVLLVGGGGREHAIAWRLSRDNPSVSIVAAPGNPGIAELAECVSVAANDTEGLMRLARERRVEFTVVGPEAPLAAGIVDHFREEGLAIFGPTRSAAEIETSKAFAKGLMQEAGVPTARAITCTEPAKAKGAVRALGLPIVIKASGLAAGKGVTVCESFEEADRAIDAMLVEHAFGVAGQEVLVEEFMQGEELSVLAITDGERVVPLVPAQDHKRLLDGDRGPNTGGMGAYAPVSLASSALLDDVVKRIYAPTLQALHSRGRPFSGLLYAGLMLTQDGPQVVEFNCRFGDPETQVVLPVSGLTVPLLDLLGVVARGEKIPENTTCTANGAAVATVLAAEGYPERPKTGVPVQIPSFDDNVLVFHAGTTRSAAGLTASGGRVLAVTGLGRTIAEARERSLDAARAITFEGKQFRSDIGWRDLSRHARVT